MIVAILCVGFSLLLWLAINPFIDDRFDLMLLVLSVVIAAHIAGPWSAFFATLGSIMVAAFFIMEPKYSFVLASIGNLLGLFGMLVVGVLIAFFSGRMSLLQRRAQRDADERLQRIVEITRQMQLNERLSLVGTLATGLAHDVGNLLMPLRSRIDAVEAELRQYHAQSDHIERLRALTDYLDSLSRGVGQLAVQHDAAHPTPTSLVVWSQTVGPLLRWTLPRNVALAINIPADLPPARIASHSLSQAVFNLVHNSAKAFHGQPGHVTIDGTFDRTGDAIKIAVRDDGPGMSEAVLRNFSESEPSVKATGQIGGMGLKVVRSIIDAAHGSMQVRSQLGAGTEICLTVPAATSDEQSLLANRNK